MEIITKPMGGKQYQIRSTSVLIKKKKKSFHFLCFFCHFPKLGTKLKLFDSKGGVYSTISYCFAQNLDALVGAGGNVCVLSPAQGPLFQSGHCGTNQMGIMIAPGPCSQKRHVCLLWPVASLLQQPAA